MYTPRKRTGGGRVARREHRPHGGRRRRRAGPTLLPPQKPGFVLPAQKPARIAARESHWTLEPLEWAASRRPLRVYGQVTSGVQAEPGTRQVVSEEAEATATIISEFKDPTHGPCSCFSDLARQFLRSSNTE